MQVSTVTLRLADAGILLAAATGAAGVLGTWAVDGGAAWYLPVFAAAAGLVQAGFLLAWRLAPVFGVLAGAVPLLGLLPRVLDTDRGTLWGLVVQLAVLCAWLSVLALRPAGPVEAGTDGHTGTAGTPAAMAGYGSGAGSLSEARAVPSDRRAGLSDVRAVPTLGARAAALLLVPTSVYAAFEPYPAALEYALAAGAVAACLLLLTVAGRLLGARREYAPTQVLSAAGALAGLQVVLLRAAEAPGTELTLIVLWVFTGTGILGSLLLALLRPASAGLQNAAEAFAPTGLLAAALIAAGVFGSGGYAVLAATAGGYCVAMVMVAREPTVRGGYLLGAQVLWAVTAVLAADWAGLAPGQAWLAAAFALALAQCLRVFVDQRQDLGPAAYSRWVTAVLLLGLSAEAAVAPGTAPADATLLQGFVAAYAVAWQLFALVGTRRRRVTWAAADVFLHSAMAATALLLMILGRSELNQDWLPPVLWTGLAVNLAAAALNRDSPVELLAPAGLAWAAAAGAEQLEVRGYLVLVLTALAWFGWRAATPGPFPGLHLLSAQGLAAAGAGLAAAELGGRTDAVFIATAGALAALHLVRTVLQRRLAGFGLMEPARWTAIAALLVLPPALSETGETAPSVLWTLILFAAGGSLVTLVAAAGRAAWCCWLGAGTGTGARAGTGTGTSPHARPSGGGRGGLPVVQGEVLIAGTAAVAAWLAVLLGRSLGVLEPGPRTALIWAVLGAGTLSAALVWGSDARTHRGPTSAAARGGASVQDSSNVQDRVPVQGGGPIPGRAAAVAGASVLGAAGFAAAAITGTGLLGLRGYELLTATALLYALAFAFLAAPRYRQVHLLGAQALAVLLAVLIAADATGLTEDGRVPGTWGSSVWLAAGAAATALQLARTWAARWLHRIPGHETGLAGRWAEYGTYALLAVLPTAYAVVADEPRRDTAAVLTLYLLLAAGIAAVRQMRWERLAVAAAAAGALPLLAADFPPLADSVVLPSALPGWAAALILAGCTAAALLGYVRRTPARPAGSPAALPRQQAAKSGDGYGSMPLRRAPAPQGPRFSRTQTQAQTRQAGSGLTDLVGRVYLAAACLYPLLALLPALRDAETLPAAISAAGAAAVLMTLSFTLRLPWLTVGYVLTICGATAGFFTWFRADLLQARLDPDEALLWQAWIAALVLLASRLLLAAREETPGNTLRARIAGVSASPLLAGAGIAGMGGVGASAVAGALTLIVALAAAVTEVPARHRELAAEVAVLPAALAVERIAWFFLGVDAFWSVQYWVLILALLAAWEFVRGRERRGSIVLAGAGAILSGAGIATVIDGNTGRQLWALLGHAGLLVFGLFTARRLFAFWGAAGIAFAVLWYLRGYTFILLALLAAVLISLAIWRLVRVRPEGNDGAGQPGIGGPGGPPPGHAGEPFRSNGTGPQAAPLNDADGGRGTVRETGGPSSSSPRP